MSSWLKDFEIKGGTITVKETGAELKIDWEIIHEALVWFIFYATETVRRWFDFRPSKQRLKFAYLPKPPRPWYLLAVMAKRAGAKTVKTLEAADAVFYFEDQTVATPPQLSENFHGRALNFNCGDISKSRVAEVFESVFGYAISVDPEKAKGPIAVKSEKNGAHDGYVAQAPIPNDPNLVYQRLIDTTVDGQWGEDLRCPMIDGTIPFIYVKRRPITKRFANVNTSVTLQDVDDLLSKDEQTKLKEFAAAMGLDLGGIDVLRDKNDGKIYVVDVNKTDMGPPVILPLKDKNSSTKILTEHLIRMIHKTDP
jgi:hypothetical protein